MDRRPIVSARGIAATPVRRIRARHGKEGVEVRMRVWLTAILAGCAQTIDLHDPPGVGSGRPDTAVDTGETDTGDTGSAHDTAEDLEAACAGERRSATIQVTFPEASDACPWGEDDNLDRQDATVTARVEQIESVELLPGTAICSLAFDFTPSEGEQMIRYDDHFFLTFDDAVLAATSAPLVAELPDDVGLPTWSWDALAGSPMPYESEAWCLGAAEGLSTCTVPRPETDGAIMLEFDESLVRALAEHALLLGRYDFGFVTIGDNDREDDCSHSAFTFSVDIEFVSY